MVTLSKCEKKIGAYKRQTTTVNIKPHERRCSVQFICTAISQIPANIIYHKTRRNTRGKKWITTKTYLFMS
jgi:hypothetical protein